MTLKLNRLVKVVETHVRETFHPAKCSGSWVIVRGHREKKNVDENNTVRRYRGDSNNSNSAKDAGAVCLNDTLPRVQWLSVSGVGGKLGLPNDS